MNRINSQHHPWSLVSGRWSLNKRRRGISFIEMAVAVGTMACISAFVAVTTLEVAKQSRKSLSMIPSDQSGHVMMDKMRNELLGATLGSVGVTNSGRTVTYQIPTRNSTSKLDVDTGSSRLYFYPNSGTNTGRQDWGKITTVLFTRLANGKVVQTKLTLPAYDRKGNSAPVVFNDTLTLRN